MKDNTKRLFCLRCGEERLSFKRITARVTKPILNWPYWTVRGVRCSCGEIKCLMMEDE